MPRTTSPDDTRQQHDAHGEGGGIGEYLLHRAKPHLPPWLAGTGAGLASLPAHYFWSGEPGVTAGLTLASVALTGLTWWAGKSTTQQRRLHSAVTVAAASTWFTAAAIAGPGAGPLGELYFIGAPALALSWNIRQILRKNVEGAGQSADGGFLEKVGLAKTQVLRTEVGPNKASFDLQLPRGELTPDDVLKNLTRIAGALDVPKTAIRIQENPDSASRVMLTVVPLDLLKNTVPCPGPSAPGESISFPVVVGIYEDGAPAVMWFPGDPDEARNAMMLLLMGMTGSGKSEGGLTALAEILTRRDVIVWASDPAKKEQTLGPLLPAIDWAALDMPSTKAMIKALTAVIPARTAWLAKYGYKQWVPACAETQADGAPGMPYLVAWFEEAAKTIREIDDDVFTGLAQEARSAGVSLVLSMQRASGNQVSTDTRASLGSSWCHGVRTEQDARFALDDDVLDAGAAPHVWKDKKPGYSYLVANGVPDNAWATPMRDYLCSVDYLNWVVVTFSDTRAAIDPVTAGAAALRRPSLHRPHPIPDARHHRPAGYHHAQRRRPGRGRLLPRGRLRPAAAERGRRGRRLRGGGIHRRGAGTPPSRAGRPARRPAARRRTPTEDQHRRGAGRDGGSPRRVRGRGPGRGRPGGLHGVLRPLRPRPFLGLRTGRPVRPRRASRRDQRGRPLPDRPLPGSGLTRQTRLTPLQANSPKHRSYVRARGVRRVSDASDTPTGHPP